MSFLLFGEGDEGSTSTVPATSRWHRAELHERFRLLAGRPATDEALTVPRIDLLLTEGQDYWHAQIATLMPHVLRGAPVKLLTSDGGLTYYFGATEAGDPVTPMGPVELVASPRGPRLTPGAFGVGGYIIDGAPSLVLRWGDGTARTFPDGPYARFVTAPPAIAEGSEPVLPIVARPLVLYRALALWAKRVKQADLPWLEEEARVWSGTQGGAQGELGVVGALRLQFPSPPMDVADDAEFETQYRRRSLA